MHFSIELTIKQDTAGRLDGLPCSLMLVKCRIVHDDRLSRAQFPNENLLHPRIENFPIGGAIINAFGDGFSVYGQSTS
jgi:hypothetical protein